MATVSSTSQTAAAGGTLAAASSKTSAGIGDSVTEDRFLKLLMAQMKNQDPLNPLDNAQVTSQMAQISTVNGIEQLNNTIKAMQEATRASNSELETMQATTMVGHQIITPGNAITLEGGSAPAAFELPAGATKVTVTIKSEAGQIIDAQELKLPDGVKSWAEGMHLFNWDGKASDKSDAKPGNYTFEVKAMNERVEVKAAPMSISTVDGVNRANGGYTVNTSRGAIDAATIKRVM